MARAAKTAVTKASAGPGTALANIDEQMAKEAAELRGRINTSEALTIKLRKDKTFQLPNGEIIDVPLKGIVVEFVARNSWFDRPFNEKEPGPPACTATGKIIDAMSPFKESPQRQADSCKDCPMNQFETAPGGGKGKACKNQRVLAFLPFNEGKIDAETPLFLINVSPTGLKNFDGFVNQVAKQFSKPPIGVVTEIAFDANATYQTLTFKALGPNKVAAACYGHRQTAEELLTRVPDFSGYVPLATGKRGGGGAPARRGRTMV